MMWLLFAGKLVLYKVQCMMYCSTKVRTLYCSSTYYLLALLRKMSKVSSSGSVSADDDDVRIVTASELEDKIRSQLISFDYVKASDLSDGCGK